MKMCVNVNQVFQNHFKKSRFVTTVVFSPVLFNCYSKAIFGLLCFVKGLWNTHIFRVLSEGKHHIRRRNPTLLHSDFHTIDRIRLGNGQTAWFNSRGIVAFVLLRFKGINYPMSGPVQPLNFHSLHSLYIFAVDFILVLLDCQLYSVSWVLGARHTEESDRG